MLRAALLLPLALPLLAANPKGCVPARWSSTDVKTLALLRGTPVNCVLLDWRNDPSLSSFAHALSAAHISPYAVLHPGADTAAQSRAALSAQMEGLVLEGDFPEGATSSVRSAHPGVPVIELTARAHMRLGGPDPVIGTFQGIWAGIQITENGKEKAAPSGSAWIDTNSGFLRFVRAWGPAEVWLSNQPPAKTAIIAERYLQMIGDAALSGAHWVVSLDPDFSARLFASDPKAIANWGRITHLLKYYEDHRDWRSLRAGGKLALVQNKAEGALLTGGILDMIATKHTPVQAVPPEKLSPEALSGATMAVNVDANALDAREREVLKQFTRSGGTLLTGPPGWRDTAPDDPARITLDEQELKRIDDMWHDVQSMIGRKNLGARLFNVSSMLSELLTTPDRKQLLVQLVNYSEYPVENVTVHVLGEWHRAHLFLPDGREKDLEVYKVEEGTGIDVDSVGVTAAIRLE